MRLRDFGKEKPENYQICFIWPKCVKAEYIDGYFLSSNESVVHINVKLWIPMEEISEKFEYPEDFL